MKQTAVEFLEEIYLTIGIDRNIHFRQAKQMEQEQMELAAWDTTLTDGLEEIEWDTKPGFVEKRMALRAQSIKEKARLLCDKFYQTTPNEAWINEPLGLSEEYKAWKQAKECALIAVDEIINTLNSDIRDLDVRGNILLDLIDYWREVKQEIEKL